MATVGINGDRNTTDTFPEIVESVEGKGCTNPIFLSWGGIHSYRSWIRIYKEAEENRSVGKAHSRIVVKRENLHRRPLKGLPPKPNRRKNRHGSFANEWDKA